LDEALAMDDNMTATTGLEVQIAFSEASGWALKILPMGFLSCITEIFKCENISPSQRMWERH